MLDSDRGIGFDLYLNQPDIASVLVDHCQGCLPAERLCALEWNTIKKDEWLNLPESGIGLPRRLLRSLFGIASLHYCNRHRP